MRLRFVITSAAAAFAIFACSDSPSAPAGPVESATVAATTALRFTPREVTIFVDGTVTWQFGSEAHNVNFSPNFVGRPANIEGANVNTSIARTFNTVGDIAYACSIHPGMSGTVRVRARE